MDSRLRIACFRVERWALSSGIASETEFCSNIRCQILQGKLAWPDFEMEERHGVRASRETAKVNTPQIRQLILHFYLNKE